MSRTHQLRVEVAGTAAEDLLRHLDARLRRNRATKVRDKERGFTFVPDVEPYHLFHNSNHQAADWLRRLGCGIRGVPIYSDFRAVQHPDPPIPP